MQKYLSPAMRYFSRMLAHSSTIQVFIDRHRKIVFASVAALLAVSTMGLVMVRGIMTNDQDAMINEKKAQGSSVTTSVSTGPDSPTNIHVTTSPHPQTSISVNNQPIDVPQNGTVSKTINNDGSTTHVTVSHSSNSSGDSTSTSATTTTNVSSSSQSIHLHSP